MLLYTDRRWKSTAAKKIVRSSVSSLIRALMVTERDFLKNLSVYDCVGDLGMGESLKVGRLKLIMLLGNNRPYSWFILE